MLSPSASAACQAGQMLFCIQGIKKTGKKQDALSIDIPLKQGRMKEWIIISMN
jgi:hypothetical protein